MRVVGIIAEYNPLHNGHIYHLERAKAKSGADFCIVVLSGNFVQRGEAACIDKYTRSVLRSAASARCSAPALLPIWRSAVNSPIWKRCINFATS